VEMRALDRTEAHPVEPPAGALASPGPSTLPRPIPPGLSGRLP
jgi:hypothetical protein